MLDHRKEFRHYNKYYCFSTKYVFKCPMLTLWNVVRNTCFLSEFKNIGGPLGNNHFLLKTDNNYSEGSKYILEIERNSKYSLEVTTLIETDYFIEVHLLGHFLTDYDIPSFKLVSLYNAQGPEETLFHAVYYLPPLICSNIDTETFNSTERQRQKLYSNMNRFIKKKEYKKYRFEEFEKTGFFDFAIKAVFTYISQSFSIHDISNLVGSKAIKNKIKLLKSNETNYEISLEFLSMEQSETNCRLVTLIKEKDDKFPERIATLEIYEKTKTCLLFSLTHKYKKTNLFNDPLTIALKNYILRIARYIEKNSNTYKKEP